MTQVYFAKAFGHSDWKREQDTENECTYFLQSGKHVDFP